MIKCEARKTFSLEDRLRAMIADDPWRMAVLKKARSLSLPDWAIGAGFIRALVWDKAHRFDEGTALGDIDLIFFDSGDISKTREEDLERRLASFQDGLPWEVRNQARMHLGQGNAPYRDTSDALAAWLETPTAVAVRLEEDDSLSFLAPYGLEDLFLLRVRPTPAALRHPEQYRARMARKNWTAIWPKVKLEGL